MLKMLFVIWTRRSCSGDRKLFSKISSFIFYLFSVKVEFAKASMYPSISRHKNRSRSRSRVHSTRRDSDGHHNISTHEKIWSKSPTRSRRDYERSPIRRREYSRERSPIRHRDSSHERSKERNDRKRHSENNYSSSISNRKRATSSSE